MGDRQAAATRMLMDYKKEVNTDFRFLIRNDELDIKILIKRICEDYRLPYRQMSLDVLGAISPVKPRTQKAPEDGDVNQKDDDNTFISPNRRGALENYRPKELIFDNITAILNGFESESEKNERKQ